MALLRFHYGEIAGLARSVYSSALNCELPLLQSSFNLPVAGKGTVVAEEKTSPVAKRIEMIANVAIIVTAIVLISYFVVNFFAGRNQAAGGPTITSGAKLALKDVSWQGSNKTLVLAVSTTCHFCSESAGFYRQLVSQCKQQHVRIIAVLPQPVAEGQSYLSNEGVAVDDVRQAVFHDIPISGTPTLLLVDGSGTVKDVWIGKLADDKEKEVLSKLIL